MEQNYFEIVAVPVLQRKCQELFNSNMILETNLHIEITKCRHALEQLEKLKTGLSSAESSSQELKSMQSTAASALSDASIYKNKYDQVSKKYAESLATTAATSSGQSNTAGRTMPSMRFSILEIFSKTLRFSSADL